MRIPYWHVDAFTTALFGGNPATVMRLEKWLDTAVLQAISVEHNFSATAFLVPDDSEDADWQVRWFSPTCELALCGHATLASGHILLANQSACRSVRFRTGHAGILEVHRADQGYELALPAIATTPGEFPQAVHALRAKPQEVWRSHAGYAIFLYDSEEQICTIEPVLQALAALGRDQFIVTAPGRDSDVISRVFVPGAGTDEDSVTGSAHAALTPFWTARLGRSEFSAYQASARGGHLSCRLDGDRVWLRGDCVTVVEGTFFLQAPSNRAFNYRCFRAAPK